MDHTPPSPRPWNALAIVALTTILTTCTTAPASETSMAYRPLAFDELPRLSREFRGLWVSTVLNLDWPSSRNLSPEQQQTEVREILDRAVALNFNAILLQVRPAGDALYRSTKEPWSYWLTGTMGKDPGYDPLAFWLAEAHARGLQLHAWFNPYRVGLPSLQPGDYSPDSLPRTRPDLVKAIGTRGYLWLNPGDPRAEDWVLEVLDEILAYDIDGLVMDDYFYPYRSFYDEGNPAYTSTNGVDHRPSPERDFPDQAEFAAAQAAGFAGSLQDWRTQVLDGFVEGVYRRVKATKPQVLVGISPFGIARPGFPPETSGMDSLVEIHTDPRRWLQEGWVDYLAPQLYWPIGQAAQSYPLLLGWWRDQNPLGRHLWPAINGAYASAAHLATPELRALEYRNQVWIQRGMNPQSPGFLFFRAGALRETVQGRPNPLLASLHPDPSDPARASRLLAEGLRQGPLARKALIPPSPWLETQAPTAPRPRHRLDPLANEVTISWEPVPGATHYVVYTHRGTMATMAALDGERRIWWDQEILGAEVLHLTQVLIRPGRGDQDAVQRYIVSAVTRLGTESPLVPQDISPP